MPARQVAQPIVFCLAKTDNEGMKAQVRIVAGSLKGRKLTCNVDPNLRPTPDMVRQALFSILGTGVPEHPFLDLFAGTGAVGLEAISRGASTVTLVERDPPTAAEIVRHVRAFGVAEQVFVQKADVYRWIERWQPPSEPVNVFLGPPFPDFEHRLDGLMQALGDLQGKLPPGSVLAVQSERSFDISKLPAHEAWDHRLYGRNRLSFWVQHDRA